MFSIKKISKVSFSLVLMASILLMPVINSFSFLNSAYASETPVLLKDINEVGKGMDLFDDSYDEITEFNGEGYFAMTPKGFSGEYGDELWKTDGTEQGTVLVKDINEGPNGSGTHGYTEFNGELYFKAYTEDEGTELWKTDGTENGTVLVKDINQGDEGSEIGELFVVNNKLIFSARDGNESSNIWQSDGTEGGTLLMSDIDAIFTEVGSDYNVTLAAQGDDDIVYFRIYEYNVNRQYLGKTDGTVLGTVLIEDQNSDPVERVGLDSNDNNEYSNFITVGNVLYFINDVPDNGIELWKYDPLDGFATMVKDITSGAGDSTINNFKQVQGNKLFFEACPSDSNCEPWITDGTEVGTVQLTDIISGGAGSSPEVVDGDGDIVFFIAQGNGENDSLWYTNGTTTAAIHLLSDREQEDRIESSVVFNGDLYFQLCNEDVECELFRTNDALSGIEIVKDIWEGIGSSEPDHIELFNDGIIFLANDGDAGFELWFSDGTENGTELIGNIIEGTESSQENDEIQPAVTENGTFFVASDGTNGFELWFSDGTEQGTYMVKDIYEGRGGSSIDHIAPFQDGVVFRAEDRDQNGLELWFSDGTEQGTYMVKDIYGGIGGSAPKNFTVLNDILYFYAETAATGTELWRSDGTEQGTYMVKDINEAGGYGNPELLTVFNGKIYFSAETDGYGSSLWTSDGTEQGTVLVKDFYATETYGTIEDIVVLGDFLYINFYDSNGGYQIWKSDGTSEGTVVFKDLDTESLNDSINELTVMGDNFYFNGYTDAHGYELWKSDGTSEGTILLKDIFVGTDSGNPVNFTAAEDKLFFLATTDSEGQELWVTDGTSEGTTITKNIYSGSNNSEVSNVVALGDIVYFNAIDEDHGYELWTSDGTEEGTALIDDILTGTEDGNPRSSNPTMLTVFEDSLFFFAEDESLGIELFILGIIDDEEEEPVDDGFELTDDLVGYWSLNENTGETRADSFADNDLTDVNANVVGVSDGFIGQAAEFTEADEYLIHADNTELSTGGETSFSLSLWVRMNEIDGTQVFVSKFDDVSTGEYAVYAENGQFRFSTYTGGIGHYVDALTAEVGEWYHLVAVHNAELGTNMLAVNVSPTNTISEVPQHQDSAGDFIIGAFGPARQYVAKSEIDEVGFWKRVLTNQDINELYNDGQGLTYSDFADEEVVEEEEEEEPSRRRGSSVQSRVKNLNKQEKTNEAEDLMNKFPQVFDSSTSNSTNLTNLSIRDLQKFLNTHGFPVSQTGPGSLNNETDIFGELTRQALIRFQQANGITPALGYFGPITKAFIANMISNNQDTPAQDLGPIIGPLGFDRDLEVGSTGEDVKRLQDFLIAQDIGLQAKALASNGSTQYFGQLTQAALVEWQQAKGIVPASGYFGPKTRAYVLSVL